MSECKRYYVYIMASRSKTLYTGITNNLRRRVLEHRQGVVEGFSKKYSTKRLVFFETSNDVRFAIRREKQIKNWRRQKKVELIGAVNPRWRDLAADWFAGASSTAEIPRLPAAGRLRSG